MCAAPLGASTTLAHGLIRTQIPGLDGLGAVYKPIGVNTAGLGKADVEVLFFALAFQFIVKTL